MADETIQWPAWVNDFNGLSNTLDRIMSLHKTVQFNESFRYSDKQLSDQCADIEADAKALKAKIEKLWRNPNIGYEENNTKRQAVEQLCAAIDDDDIVKTCMKGMSWPDIDQILAGTIVHLHAIAARADQRKVSNRPTKHAKRELIARIIEAAWQHGIDREAPNEKNIEPLLDIAIPEVFGKDEQLATADMIRKGKAIAANRLDDHPPLEAPRLELWTDIASIRAELAAENNPPLKD